MNWKYYDFSLHFLTFKVNVHKMCNGHKSIQFYFYDMAQNRPLGQI